MKKTLLIICLFSLASLLLSIQTVFAVSTCGQFTSCPGYTCQTGECQEQTQTNGFTITKKCVCFQGTGTGDSGFANPGMPKFSNPLDTLQVPLPTGFMNTKNGIKCEPGAKEGEFGNCQVPFIAEYIAGWFKYAVGIGGLLGVMVAMIGGFLWIVSAGNPQKISEAKGWITNGVIGIALLLTSYIILYQVNPELTQLKSISIGYINKDEPEDETGFADSDAALLVSSLVNAKFNTNTKNDFESGKVQACARQIITDLDKAGIKFRVSTLITGHNKCVKGTEKTDGSCRVSAHFNGKGVDIGCHSDEQANCMALMKYIYENMRGQVGQAFFTPAIQYQWREGASYQKAVPGHGDHIHLGC